MPSVSQQWKGLQTWFLHYLTSPDNLLWLTHTATCSPHSKTCLFANHSTFTQYIYLCPPLCSRSFRWQCKVSICDSAIWLPTGFSLKQPGFIAEKVLTLLYNGHLTFQCVIDNCGTRYGFFCLLPSLFVVTGFMQRSFLHVCNTV